MTQRWRWVRWRSEGSDIYEMLRWWLSRTSGDPTIPLTSSLDSFANADRKEFAGELLIRSTGAGLMVVGLRRVIGQSKTPSAADPTSLHLAPGGPVLSAPLTNVSHHLQSTMQMMTAVINHSWGHKDSKA